MKEQRFEATVVMEPVPKGRPRTFITNGRARTVTPTATQRAEMMIRLLLARELKAMIFGKGVPVRLEVTFYRLRPASAPKRVSMPVTAPDWDNYAKLVTDAMERAVYYSDAQITTALVRKRFGSPPRIEIKLEVDNEQSNA